MLRSAAAYQRPRPDREVLMGTTGQKKRPRQGERGESPRRTGDLDQPKKGDGFAYLRPSRSASLINQLHQWMKRL
jgi:hypothetical protein